MNLDIRAGETNPIPDDCQGEDPASAPAYPNWPQNDWAGNPSHAVSGDLMQHQQVLYRANWWTQSVPGSDESWTQICAF